LKPYVLVKIAIHSIQIGIDTNNRKVQAIHVKRKINSPITEAFNFQRYILDYTFTQHKMFFNS